MKIVQLGPSEEKRWSLQGRFPMFDTHAQGRVFIFLIQVKKCEERKKFEES